MYDVPGSIETNHGSYCTRRTGERGRKSVRNCFVGWSDERLRVAGRETRSPIPKGEYFSQIYRDESWSLPTELVALANVDANRFVAVSLGGQTRG
jgi:hypothetical protein